MSVQMIIISALSTLAGVGVGMCSADSFAKRFGEGYPPRVRLCLSVVCLLPGIGGLFGLLWCFLSPPMFSEEVSGPPSFHRNDPTRSMYFGNGCFWHTQYDFVVLEQDKQGVFGGRSYQNVTSLVGYAGGRYQTASGTACYHGLPGSDYSKLGHGEVVSVTLDAITGPIARAQVTALAEVYFEHGFATVSEGRERLDPQDAGAEYRNAIGLPGGMDNAELWPLVVDANTYGMPLVRGNGGTKGDTEDQFVVYVYDSSKFPFFRGEAYHQFHPNTVIGRPVPDDYTSTLKNVQTDIGRLDSTGCAEIFAEVAFLIIFAFSLLIGLTLGMLRVVFPRDVCPARPRIADEVAMRASEPAQLENGGHVGKSTYDSE